MNEQLNQKRLQKADCDLVIRIADKEFLAHREVLTKRLRFFGRQISAEMLKEKQTVIVLEPTNVDLNVFEDVLQYIYISQIKFTTANMEAIYRTADYLRFDDLLDEAEKAMKNVSKTEKMIVVLMNIAKDYKLASIESECKQSIISNPLSEVGKKHLIPALTFGHLKVLLKRMNDRKEDMFNLCVEWVRSDQTNRSRRLPESLNLIPLSELSTEFLNETVFNNAIVRNYSDALVLLIEALKSSKSRSLINSETSNSQSLNRSFNALSIKTFNDSNSFPVLNKHTSKSRASDCLYAIGGYDVTGLPLRSVSKLSSLNSKWVASTPMPCPRYKFGCAVIGRKIYICGGWNERQMNELTVYDTDTEQWTQLRPIKYARYGCAMAALNGFLYVAGGYNGRERLSVVERYSLENNDWEIVTSMTTKRKELELVAMNGFLYAIGGEDQNNKLGSVERYCPQTNEWKAVASLIYGCGSSTAAVLDNRIYVTCEASQKSYEVYHPEDDKWRSMPKPFERSEEERLAVFNGILLAIGGYENNSYDRNISQVKRFDFKANVWVPEADMDVDRFKHRVAVVTKY